MMKGWLARIFRGSNDGLQPITLDDIARYLSSNPVIVEAGAHIGTDTVAMAKKWKHAAIHAFEPVPGLFVQLKDRTKNYPNIICYPVALSDVVGSGEMYISSGSSDASSSLLAPKEHLSFHPDVAFTSKISVKCITLDSWAKANQVERIDFLWLDLQGYELNALMASVEILKNVKAIHAEALLVESYRGSHLYPEMKEWMAGKGFVVAKEYLKWRDGGNVLFVRK